MNVGGTWATDGTRVLANAGKGSVANRDQLERELARLRSEIDAAIDAAEAADAEEDRTGHDDDDDTGALPEGLKTKADRAARVQAAIDRIDATNTTTSNATDPDAPTMQRTSVRGAAPAYNAQATVSAASGLIVAADVCTDQTDYGQLLPLLDEGIANTVARPDAILADAGYASGPNFAGLAARGIVGYVSQRTPRGRRSTPRSDASDATIAPPFSLDEFAYDADRDEYRCPANRVLSTHRRERRETKSGCYDRLVYRSSDCSACDLAVRCKPPRSVAVTSASRNTRKINAR